MSETKHTPGPWEAYNAEGNGRILKHWHIRGSCVRNDPTFAVIDSGGKLLPEYEAANARLISAAPELLEACKGHGFNLPVLLAKLTPGHVITDTEAELLADQSEYVRAVIAKAQGECK